MEAFPELITKRLKLRRIRISDVPSLLALCSNKKISDQIVNIPYPYTEEDAIARMNFVLQGFRNAERYVFVITFSDKDELIGEIGLHLDKSNNSAVFGYWVGEPFWGRGIATEAASAILRFGFDTLKLNKISATHYPENVSSGKVMLKNKMIKEAELIDQFKVNEEYRTVVQYRLTKKEYDTGGEV